LSSPSNITSPFLILEDASNDTGVFPLLELEGGLASDSLGIEVTSQSVITAGTAPSLSNMAGGFGGLSLVQLGGATSAAGQSSPVFSMCAQQYTTLTQPACWSWQVLGGAGSDPSDILSLTRQTTNSTNIITVLFPASVNLATAANSATGTAGQITVGPAPYSGANANVPSTFTGANTTDGTDSTAAAGPVTVQPGQLTAASPVAGATEGALQILQSYLGTNGTACANCGFLACPSGTAQSVVPCTTTGQAENWVGVFDGIVGQAGGSITPLRYGRVGVKSSGAAAKWTNGDFVCKDDSNASYSRDNSNNPCPTGESIGIAVGDPSTTNMHLTDLVPEASTGGGALMTFYCTGSVAAGSTLYMFPAAAFTACASSTTTTIIQPVSFTGTIKNLEVLYATAPGTGHTDTFTVYKCPALASCAATSITCSISGTSTPSACSDVSHAVAVSQGDGVQLVDGTGTSSAAASVRATIQIQ
jgi:hypothetical protein